MTHRLAENFGNGRYDVQCEINRKGTEYSTFTCENIPAKEPHLRVCDVVIRVDNLENIKDTFKNLPENDEVNIESKVNKRRHRFAVEKPIDYHCHHCGEKFDGEVFCIEEINEFMNWVDRYHEFHEDCFREILEILEKEILPDFKDRFASELVSSRL